VKRPLPPGIRCYDTARGTVYLAIVSHGRAGGQRSKAFDTLDDAVGWKAGQEIAKRTGRRTLPGPAKVTVAAAWAEWRARTRLERNTLAGYDSHYRRRIGPLLGHRPVTDLTPLDLDLWVNRMAEDGHNPPTIARTVSALSALLADAVRNGDLPFNPVKLMADLPVEEEPEHRPLEGWEAEVLLKASPDHYRPLWQAKLRTGARIGELLALRVAHVNLSRRLLTIRANQLQDGTVKLYTKGRRKRDVRIPAKLAEVLAPLVDGRPAGAQLFTREDGTQLTYDHLSKRVWPAMIKAAGLADPQPTPHDLRHTAGTWLGEAGFSDRQIADQLGHAQTATTQIYVHPSSESARRIAEALDDAF
jgi:integrase